MKQYKKTISGLFAPIFVAFIPLISFAQITNPLKGLDNIPAFVSSMLVYVVRIGGVIAIFAFIYSGYKFVAARGNPTELQAAKSIFINTCIGVAVLLGAQLIASIIIGTIGNLR